MPRILAKGVFNMPFKELRERAGLTQADVADRLRIKRSTVSMWEINKSSPRADLLPKLAKIFNCTIDELFK